MHNNQWKTGGDKLLTKSPTEYYSLLIYNRLNLVILIHAILSIPLLIRFFLLVMCVYLKDVQQQSSRSSRVVRIRAFSREADVVEEEALSSG